MIPRRITAILFACVLVAAGALAATSGSEAGGGYRVHLHVDDAFGLRDGSKVVVGGVEVGRVKVGIGAGDRVDIEAKIDGDHAPIGRDAQAFVTSVNLLGEKSLELNPGNAKADPAPSGYVVPSGRLTPSTDLDQVLDVLDPGTRARLTVLINEAGVAFTGRRADFSQLLQQLPTSLTQGTALLDRLVSDHRTLAALVARSDRFVGALVPQRVALGGMLDAFGRASETFATKRTQLRGTLRGLPGTLRTARAFLDDLRRTTVPLGPAARDLEATAGPLASTLRAVGPFTTAATPALHEAAGVAPKLTRLADGATPTLRRAVPTLRSLAAFSRDLAPISDILMRSADNIVGTAANWAHAIQFRDALGHVFRAQVGVTPQSVNAMVDRLVAFQNRRRVGRQRPAVPKLRLPARRPEAPKRIVDEATKPLRKVTARGGAAIAPVLKALGQTTGLLQGSTPPDRGGSSLLDYLLKP